MIAQRLQCPAAQYVRLDSACVITVACRRLPADPVPRAEDRQENGKEAAA